MRLAGAMTALIACCSGGNVPRPDLAHAIRASDAIVVGQVVAGNAYSDNAGASAELILRVVRVLKGEVAPESEITVKISGSRSYFPGPVSGLPTSRTVDHFTALWFLHCNKERCSAVPVTRGAGEPEHASLALPEDSAAMPKFSDPYRAVAEEIVATLRVMEATHGDAIFPVPNVQMINGTLERSCRLGRYSGKALELTEALRTLGDRSTLLTIYRELAADPSEFLRPFGVGGVIGFSDPAGPKQAAAEFRALFRNACISPSLGGYLNPADGEAVQAIGRLATESLDGNMPAQGGAAYALNAIHTKEAMPGLIALLDSENPWVAGRALNGICLFIRNAPLLTSDSIATGSELQSREPAPYRNKDTDAYC